MSHNQDILKGYNMLLYFGGSMIMHEPSQECVVDFWEKGILKKLPVSSSNPNFIIAASQLKDSFAEKSTFAKLLREDYIRLFATQVPALAPAYESLYSKDTFRSSNKNFSSVSDFYKSYGWESKFKGKIDDDHLGIELLFLTKLIDKYMVLDDIPSQAEMSKEICRFINTHILSWIREWNTKIQFHSNTLSYKGIGNLILACVEDVLELFGQKYSVSVTTDSSKN